MFLPCGPDGREVAVIPAATQPPYAAGGSEPPDDHFDRHGRWIGPDWERPYRVVTPGAAALGAAALETLYIRYDAADYGAGEVGFAAYVWEGQQVWLIDDATRSPEGEPPARDPRTSPGPQTLLLPDEY
jgi:hypothetical protein